MLALYAATSIGVWLIFRVISGAINAIHLSAFDHQLGLLLGLAKGAMLCIVVTFFAVTLAPAYRDQIVASRSGRLVAELIVRADTYLPKEIHDTVNPFVKQFEEKFQGPGGMPGASFARPQPGLSQPGVAQQSPTGQPSPLQAIWEGVTSAAAWAGTEQGGQGGQGGQGRYAAQQAGGTLPPGASWFVPREDASRGLRGGQPAAAAAPPRSAGSAFATPPGQFQPPPQQFPIGAQSQLPGR